MDLTSTQLIVMFFSNVDIFLLILIRFMAFFIIVPVLSGSNYPLILKIGFAFSIALIMVSAGKISVVTYDDSIMGFVTIFVKEFMIGFTIGFAVYIVYTILFFVGQLADYQIGFSMVSVLDPTTQLQVPVVGNIFYFIILIFLIQFGGLNAFIQAVFDSYDILPIGGAVFVGNEGLMHIFLKLVSDYFMIGTRLSLPVVGSILIIDIAMGLLVKAAPQMNIFVVGMPIKLFAGIIVLYFTIPVFDIIYKLLFNEAFQAILDVIRGMMA